MVARLFAQAYVTLAFESRFDLTRKYDNEVMLLELLYVWL